LRPPRPSPDWWPRADRTHQGADPWLTTGIKTQAPGAAKGAYTTRDLEQQTRGVECRKDAGVVYEIPGVCKSIEKVIDQQRDLVEVVAKLKQVI